MEQRMAYRYGSMRHFHKAKVDNDKLHSVLSDINDREGVMFCVANNEVQVYYGIKHVAHALGVDIDSLETSERPSEVYSFETYFFKDNVKYYQIGETMEESYE